MSKLDLKRKQLEYQRVTTAQMDLELKIEERLEEIERLKEHVEIQRLTAIKLKEEINSVK